MITPHRAIAAATIATLCLACVPRYTYDPGSGSLKYYLRNVPVYADGELYPSHHLLGVATTIYLDQVAERFDWPIEDLEYVFRDLGSVSFRGHALAYDDGLADGLYVHEHNDVYVSYIDDCLLTSSYWHELNHHFLRYLTGDSDHNHTCNLWWDDLLQDVIDEYGSSSYRLCW